ncbi:hypothetical protein Droror1_Dr00005767 [Drosera rotundifolia]
MEDTKTGLITGSRLDFSIIFYKLGFHPNSPSHSSNQYSIPIATRKLLPWWKRSSDSLHGCGESTPDVDTISNLGFHHSELGFHPSDLCSFISLSSAAAASRWVVSRP